MTLKNYFQFKKTGRLSPGFLKKHPAWFLTLLSFLLIVYALIIFGLYAVEEPPATEENTRLRIKQELYQPALDRLQARDTNIQWGMEQTYPNIFQ